MFEKTIMEYKHGSPGQHSWLVLEVCLGVAISMLYRYHESLLYLVVRIYNGIKYGLQWCLVCLPVHGHFESLLKLTGFLVTLSSENKIGSENLSYRPG